MSCIVHVRSYLPHFKTCVGPEDKTLELKWDVLSFSHNYL